MFYFTLKDKLVCQQNPCLNEAICIIVDDTFKCLCPNSSYVGKYCEIYRPSYSNSQTDRDSPQLYDDLATRSMLPAENFKSSTAISPLSQINSTSDLYPQDVYTTKSMPTIKQTSARTYFWQCQSNCFYSLGQGFCALSQSGFPHCVCHIGWTGMDCSQKNYCLENNCVNNSTCVNYSEMR